MEVLIGLGANVDAQDNEGNTALHVATRTRHTAIAQLLLRAGANTELTDEVKRFCSVDIHLPNHGVFSVVPFSWVSHRSTWLPAKVAREFWIR